LTERGVALTLPVCEYHKRRGRQADRTFFRGAALAVALGIAAYAGSLFDGAAGNYLGVAAMIAFLATILVGMHEVDDGLGVKSLQRDTVTLGGVNPDFAEALERRPQGLRTG
jgi:hypothetical protein